MPDRVNVSRRDSPPREQALDLTDAGPRGYASWQPPATKRSPRPGRGFAAPSKLTAQNGRTHDFNPVVVRVGCGKKGKKRR